MNAKRSTLTRILTTTLGALVLGACSDSTGPEGQARVTATISDAPGPATVAYYSGDPGPQPAAFSFSGQMQGSAQVFIYSEAHGWVSLGSPAAATLALQSSNATTVHGTASVPAGTYTRVRLVLDGTAAHIGAGADLGGLILGAGVTITMGGSDGRIEIEKSVSTFRLLANTSVTLDFDLNSEAWVNQTTAQAQAVSDTEVASATQAKVHTE